MDLILALLSVVFVPDFDFNNLVDDLFLDHGVVDEGVQHSWNVVGLLAYGLPDHLQLLHEDMLDLLGVALTALEGAG